MVGITADRRWEEQAELLLRRGASILHGPSITTQYLASDPHLEAATLDVIDRPPDYLVATTGIGMRAWLEAAAAWGLGDGLDEALVGAKIVARGPKSAAAVQAGGLPVWGRSATEQLGGVIEILLAEPLAGRRVAVQEYGMKSPELRQVLDEAGAEVVEVPVYRWRVPAETGPAMRLVEAACEGRVDAITFTSAPAVHNLFQIAADHGAADDLRKALNNGVAAVCVGPVCAEGATEEGITHPIAPGDRPHGATGAGAERPSAGPAAHLPHRRVRPGRAGIDDRGGRRGRRAHPQGAGRVRDAGRLARRGRLPTCPPRPRVGLVERPTRTPWRPPSVACVAGSAPAASPSVRAAGVATSSIPHSAEPAAP